MLGAQSDPLFLTRTEKVNQRQIAAALREAVFTPGKPGSLKIIADTGNVDYFIRRAIETLKYSLSSPTKNQKTDYLTIALSLIALSKVTINEQISSFDSVHEK